jgi:hypothetical protein
MDPLRYMDAPTGNGERVLISADGSNGAPGHDIPHPIGDPDEDEGLPGEDDDDDTDDDDDEEPLQVRGGIRRVFCIAARKRNFCYNQNLAVICRRISRFD